MEATREACPNLHQVFKLINIQRTRSCCLQQAMIESQQEPHGMEYDTEIFHQTCNIRVPGRMLEWRVEWNTGTLNLQLPILVANLLSCVAVYLNSLLNYLAAVSFESDHCTGNRSY